MISLNSVLFNPKFNNSMAALDDQTSMFSVAARDAVGSSGRIGMEYQRDKHGGRERLLEEALTLAIWGFGVRAIKQVYDASMLGALKGLGVKLPDLDTGMLPQAGKELKPGSQVLSEKLVEKFTKQFKELGDKGQYQILEDMLKAPASQRTYQISSIAKFGAASILPAAAIAFAVPTLNQWITRQLVSKEDKAKQMTAKPSHSAAAKLAKPVANPWAAPMAKTPWAPAGFNHAPAVSAAGANANTQNSPFAAAAAPQAFGAQAAAMPPGQPFAGKSPFSHQGAGNVKFAGIGSMASNAASTILQNEQYNTLLIDGVISGGRTYKARNHVERAEIIFREVSLILFLYFAQGYIQNGINKGLGKAMHIPASLGFKDLQYIKGLAEKDPEFINTFKAHSKDINVAMEKYLKGKVTGDFGLQELLASPEHRTDALVHTIHNYFLHDRNVPGKNNIVFETAIESGHIPTFGKPPAEMPNLWEQMKAIGKELNPAAEKNLTKNPYLDLTKKINTSAVHELQTNMTELTKKVAGKELANVEKELPNMLNKVMRLRAGSLLASNVACFAALSVVFPEIQHWITYKMTGKNYFPGIQNGDQPQPPKQVKVG